MLSGSAWQRGDRVTREELVRILEFVDKTRKLTEQGACLSAADPRWNLVCYAVRRHCEGKLITSTGLAAAAEVPYGTAMRRIHDLIDEGLLLKRVRSKTGKSFSLHPTRRLIEAFESFALQLKAHVGRTFGFSADDQTAEDYYFGGAYVRARLLSFPSVLEEGIGYERTLRILSPSDPTFRSLADFSANLKEFCGGRLEIINLSLDALHGELVRNAARPESKYDIVAIDLPWMGELVESASIVPLNAMIEAERYRYYDFHSAAWKASGYNAEQFALPIQPTAELLFYRTDLFEQLGLFAPLTTSEVLDSAKILHRSTKGLSGIVMNYGRGTPVGHTFMHALADFGQPLINLPRVGSDFALHHLSGEHFRPQIDSEAGHRAAEFLLELLDYAHPHSLECHWDRRIKLFAEGKAAMTYGWSIRASVFEGDEQSPAHGRVGYLPHPPAPGRQTVSPIGGFSLAIPANLPEERIEKAWVMMKYLTQPEMMKWYVLNGNLSSPRFSTSADPEVQAFSPLIEQVDRMEKKGQLQSWPRPPIPEFDAITHILGEEIHAMLGRDSSIGAALQLAQSRIDKLMRAQGHY